MLVVEVDGRPTSTSSFNMFNLSNIHIHIHIQHSKRVVVKFNFTSEIHFFYHERTARSIKKSRRLCHRWTMVKIYCWLSRYRTLKPWLLTPSKSFLVWEANSELVQKQEWGRLILAPGLVLILNPLFLTLI